MRSYHVSRFLLLICLLGRSVFAPVAAAQAPMLPHAFYGAVEINGAPAPIGVMVEARASGIRTGIDGNPLVTTAVGGYGGSGVFAPKLVVQGDLVAGRLIEFYVNEVRAQCAVPGGDWQDAFPFDPGAVTHLDLSVMSEAQTETPAASPTLQPVAPTGTSAATLTRLPILTHTPTLTPLPTTTPTAPAPTLSIPSLTPTGSPSPEPTPVIATFTLTSVAHATATGTPTLMATATATLSATPADTATSTVTLRVTVPTTTTIMTETTIPSPSATLPLPVTATPAAILALPGSQTPSILSATSTHTLPSLAASSGPQGATSWVSDATGEPDQGSDLFRWLSFVMLVVLVAGLAAYAHRHRKQLE